MGAEELSKMGMEIRRNLDLESGRLSRKEPTNQIQSVVACSWEKSFLQTCATSQNLGPVADPDKAIVNLSCDCDFGRLAKPMQEVYEIVSMEKRRRWLWRWLRHSSRSPQDKEVRESSSPWLSVTWSTLCRDLPA